MTLFLLICAHSLCDFPLQADFLARAKNHRAPVAAANGQPFPWWIALGAHATIHGGAVTLVTGSLALGVAETAAHAVIDYATSAGKTGGYVGDQALHLACKVLWWALLVGATA